MRLEDIIANFTGIRDASGVDKVVGGLVPNDGDGNASGDAMLGLPGFLLAAGCALTDPGRYQPQNHDVTSQITAFKPAGVQTVTGVMIPPDFAGRRTSGVEDRQQQAEPQLVNDRCPSPLVLGKGPGAVTGPASP